MKCIDPLMDRRGEVTEMKLAPLCKEGTVSVSVGLLYVFVTHSLCMV